MSNCPAKKNHKSSCWTLAVLVASAAVCPAEPILTESGLIEGRQEQSLTVFRGVPYAMPPVGDLRWREPRPPAPWAGVREADHFSPVCPQQGASVPGAAQEPTSEDCLYLNIWAPAHPGGSKLPVMVWLYGGGWTTGSASMPLYWGDQLAARGVVVVTVGYRVGAFGFLAHPELTQESPHRVSGNYGLLDQVAALRWVQRNIRAFGGDPACVTIFGQSAGSMSVCLLMSSPLAKGLFQRAIGESGGVFSPPAAVPGSSVLFLPGAEQIGLAFQKQLGASSLAGMRQVPASEIVKAEQDLPFLFTFDGYVLDRQPYDAFSSGLQNDVPLLVGSNADEGQPFLEGARVTAANFKAGLAHSAFSKIPESVLAHYPYASDKEAFQSRAALERDVRFGWDMWTWASLQAKAGKSPVYYYNFGHRPPAPDGSPWVRWGAGHWAELPYVFGHPAQAPGAWTRADRALSGAMIGYWTNFARRGDPNGPGLDEWPAFSGAQPQALHFDSAIRIGGVANLEKLEAIDEFFALARRSPIAVQRQAMLGPVTSGAIKPASGGPVGSN
jgi:para-nitrobenzyl esterase